MDRWIDVTTNQNLSFLFLLHFQDARFVIYAIGLLISVIFLTATLAIGFLLPPMHHVLHWRCQTYYVACLLVGDLFLAITQIFGSSIQRVLCISMGMYCHFFFHRIRKICLIAMAMCYTFNSLNKRVKVIVEMKWSPMH